MATKRGAGKDPLNLESPASCGLVGLLGREFFMARSSAFLPRRHGILNERRYREALRGFAARPGPREQAARGRVLRLLGETGAARRDLDAAIRRDPDHAAALAWRWELESDAGPCGTEDLDRAIALEPGNGWWRAWKALSLTCEGLREGAVSEAQAAAALLPGAALPLAIEGLIDFKLARHAPALAALDRALRLEPKMEWAYRLRAMCRYETGDRAGCLADCAEAMRLDENAGLLFVVLGLHKLKTDTRMHIDVSTRHIEAHPGDFWAYVFRADNRRSPEIGENQGAVEDLKRAVELEPRHGWAWAYLSRCQLTLGDLRAAGESIDKAAALDPDCGWIRAWRGEFLRRSGDVPAAAESLDLALRLFPDYELAHAWRGSARRILGRPRAALADLDVAIKLKPHTLDLCYFERMLALRALGRVGEALEDLQRASRLNPKYVWETEPKRFGKALAELDAELRRDPRSALAHTWRGDILIRMRDFAEAERALGRAIARPSCPHEALILRGRARGELKRWRAALADFDAAVKKCPESAFVYAWRGRARMVLGRHAKAVEDFDRALEKERNSAWILSWKGEAEFKLKRFRAAESSLNKALDVHFRYADAFLWRGAARLFLGDRDGAASDLDRALGLQPENAIALYYRGHLHRKAGLDDEAREDFAKALAEPSLLSAAEVKEIKALRRPRPPRKPGAGGASRARALQREGRHAEAADIYTALLEEAPRDVEVHRLRAEAYRCMGRYDLALRDQDAVVRLRPRDAEALTGRIETKRHLRDFEGGLEDAEAALALDPRSASAWLLRSECQRSLGRYGAAVESASQGVACDPSWAWALVVRAKAKRQGGDLEGALADTRLAEKDGTDAYARGWRAEILRKAGRLEEALPDILAAVARQPTNAWFLALKGQIQCDLGSLEKGLADLQESMRLDPRCSCEHDFLGSEPREVREDKALSWVYALRGGVHRSADRLEAARADLDRAARLDPRCFWIVAWRGELLVSQGETKAGLAEIRRALKLFPRYAQARIWEGRALLKDERTKEALGAFTAALAIEPNNVWGLIGRAVCLEKTGKPEEAGALLARAQALAPALFAR